jgi:tRNA(Ile)-lysidine synthase TilS/MesJ
VEWGLSELATHPNIILLGDCHAKRLPIFSFLIRHPETGRFLHYNYVCSLLNDLFGIQTRGGCMCAGPYAQDLLGIDEQLALKIESLLLEDSRLNRVHLRRYHECSGNEILRPGLVRFNLPYFIPNDTISFILQAIQLVADNGWKLLPQYNFNPETGEWRHQQQHQALRDRVWLGNISYVGGKVSFPEANSRPLPPKDFEDSLKLAIEVFETAHKGAPQLGDQTLLFNEEGESMRWFLLPSEAQQILNGQMHHSTVVLPFYPRCTYKRSTGFSVVVAKDINPTTPSLEFNYCSSLQECSDDVSQCHTMIESFKDSQEPDKPQWLYDTCEFEYSDTKVNSPLCWQPKGSSKCEQDRSMLSIENETCTQHASEEQQTQPTGRNDKPKFFSPPKKIMKQTIQAIDDYDMIQNGDSILVGVSGGKDSLSLLHTLRQYQFYAKSKGVHFKLGAVTVDPQTSSYDPSPLKVYLAGLEIPYFYEEQGIIEQASQLAICNSICSFCSRMKRGRLYACLRHEGYNVLALGQHLDDLAESFIMSVFHNGLLRTMKAHYTVTEGDLRVIRPFVYVRERDLRSFAASAKLPVIPENCPACFEAPTERHRTKQLLAAQEILFPNLYQSFQSALKPLMSINRTGMESRLLSSVQSTLKARQDIFDESL